MNIQEMKKGFAELGTSYAAQGHAWADIWQATVAHANEVAIRAADVEGAEGRTLPSIALQSPNPAESSTASGAATVGTNLAPDANPAPAAAGTAVGSEVNAGSTNERNDAEGAENGATSGVQQSPPL